MTTRKGYLCRQCKVVVLPEVLVPIVQVFKNTMKDKMGFPVPLYVAPIIMRTLSAAK